MRIILLTPGAGKMYCGACMRDNALTAALRRLGHEATMTPLYLPLTLDEEDQSAASPIFYGGVSVYLEQQSGLFRRAPLWLRHLLARRGLLKLAAGQAAGTRPERLGPITLSMLRGEEGNQARELEELLDWLRVEKPDVVCLSNLLLIGMARRLREELRAPILCCLQGEDWFLDQLPPQARDQAWALAAERAADVALFISPSRYFAELMRPRMRVARERVRVIHNGINLEGYAECRQKFAAPNTRQPPTLGYLARMCSEKGLEHLIEAFLIIKKRGRVPGLKLRVGGSCGPSDQILVDAQRERLAAAGLSGEVEFLPNLSRAAKLDLLASLTVFSVPAVYHEPFGLYVIEAMAAGVPVVQPDHCAFPEIIEATGGGIICPPGSVSALADAIEALLLDSAKARALGEAGCRAVESQFSAEQMARRFAGVFGEARATFSAS